MRKEKIARAVSLAQGMNDCLEEYLDKAAAVGDRDVREFAVCILGTRLAPHCGCCFCLPPLEEV